MKKLNKETEDKIIDLYINKKMSTTKISKEINISPTGVSKVIKRNGYSMRSISQSKKGVKIGSNLPDEKIIDLYVNKNMTAKEIGELIKYSKTSVLKSLKNSNITIRKASLRKNYKNPKIDDIKKLYLSGLSIPKVSKEVGLSYSGTHKILKKLGIIRTQNRGKGMVGTTMSKEHKNSVIKTKKLKKESGAYDHIYKQRTGYTYKEYQKILPKFKKYYQEVRVETNNQPLNTLDNYDKRGQAGIDGNYHLDHKFSIAEGFRNNIEPKIIGNIKNLEMIPWEDNLMKNQKCSITKLDLIKLYNLK